MMKKNHNSTLKTPRSAGRRRCSWDALMLIAVVAAAAIMLLHWQERRAFRAELNALRLERHEINLINENLSRRSAGDCELTREWYGFKCVEKSGKIYRVFL